MSLTVVILTFNEAVHLARALSSVEGLADHVYVIDSGSTDETRDIAHEAGATVLSNPFVTQAQQFNWALAQLPTWTDWIFRLDADEIMTAELAEEIKTRLPEQSEQVSGILISRRMTFMGGTIWRGGLFPVRVLRLFRHGRGRSEQRWMDEHIRVEGPTADFRGQIIDDNLKPLSWWIDKHNSYASREVVDLLNLEYSFMPHDTVANLRLGQQAGVKRWVKERIYARLPGGFRVFVYFFYRYILRLGFLDSREGRAFHVLQGFWYRYLVDAKLHEVKRYMQRNNVDVSTAIREILGIEVPR